MEVEYDDVFDYLSWHYSESESKFYAVGVDYTVNEDSIFFSNGISYGVISLVLENDGWRICEDVQIAEPEALLEKGYEFSDEYNSTIEMMEARQRGILMNGDGEVFDTIGRTVTIKNNSTSDSQISTFSANATNIPFRTYCIGAAAGECGTTTFDGTARQAIIIAIKTFTWYSLINPQDRNHGVNIMVYGKVGSDKYFYTGNQAYRPRAVSGNPNIAEDYRVVETIWMEDSDNKIFKAYHKGGEYSMYRSVGKSNIDYDYLSQNGCRYLVDKKVYNTVYQTLRYYYDGSRNFNGPIKFFYK